MMSQSPSLGNQSGLTSTQPWHIMFDLLASSQKDVINGLSIDNFSKFYLNCFIKRLWPVLQSVSENCWKTICISFKPILIKCTILYVLIN
jgi:hypothetical protein